MYQIKESDKTKALKAILKMKNQHETWNKTHIEKKFKKIKHKKENFSISPGGCWIKADKVQKAADRLKSFSLNNYHIRQKKVSPLKSSACWHFLVLSFLSAATMIFFRPCNQTVTAITTCSYSEWPSAYKTQLAVFACSMLYAVLTFWVSATPFTAYNVYNNNEIGLFRNS